MTVWALLLVGAQALSVQGVDKARFKDCRLVSLSVEAFQYSNGSTGEDVEQCDKAVGSSASRGLDMGVTSAAEEQGRKEELGKAVQEATDDGLSAATDSKARRRRREASKDHHIATYAIMTSRTS